MVRTASFDNISEHLNDCVLKSDSTPSCLKPRSYSETFATEFESFCRLDRMSNICCLPPHIIEFICKILIANSDTLDFSDAFRDILSLRSTCRKFYETVNQALLQFPFEVSSQMSHLLVKKSRFCRFLSSIMQNTVWTFSRLEIVMPKEVGFSL